MRIERLQVETEGFLAGLDIRFSSGLNVIIGARGTGKTSIVELIRFCLSAGSFTEDAGTRGRQQAVAILDGGAVTLTISDGDTSYMITRSASGHVATTGGPSTVECTILAPNEVEAVGAQASGRLHLIDRFRPGRDQSERSMEAVRSQLRSLTVELGNLLNDGRALVEEVAALSSTTATLDEAKAKQQVLLASSKATQEQQDHLQTLQRTGQTLAAREAVIAQDSEQVSSFRSMLSRLDADAPTVLQEWPEYAGADLLSEQRPIVDEIGALLAEVTERVSLLEGGLVNARAATMELRAQIDTQSRQVRQQLEVAQTGIGHASRRVTELQEQQGQLHAMTSRLIERRQRFAAVSSERDALYEQLDGIRNSIFLEREKIVTELNSNLSPVVRVRLNRSENVDDYRAAIVAGLRGSGVHYNSLAPQLAREVSPQELVAWVENADSKSLGAALAISPERAAAIIAGLQSEGAAEIISSSIDDGVGLDLLDGLDYKASERLSIGQRCTVVLPVLLGHHGDPLVLDQPEDHLDNAFIASTLVPALGL